MARQVLRLVTGILLLAVTPGWAYVDAPDAQRDALPTQIVLRVATNFGSARSVRTPAASGFGVPELARLHERFAISQATTLLPRSDDAQAQHPLRNIWIVETPQGTDLEALLTEYRSIPEVVYAELDRPLRLFEVNDSLYAMQWALHNTGQPHPAVVRVTGAGNDSLVYTSGLPGADIDADVVLSVPTTSGRPAVVAIIDTGVDPNHPELAGLMWRNAREIPGNGTDDDHNGYTDDANGWDHSGDVFRIPPINNGDANPVDYHGHGTHCAGIAAARANNTRGMAGVGGDCRIMAVKIFPLALTSVSARAIVYAADNGADVISMSWGGPWRAQVLEEAVAYAHAAGVVLVAATGNEGNGVPMYPAAYPGVIAVGATDDSDHVTGFSNFGEHLSLVAPGQDILSLRANGTDMYAPAEPGVHKIGTGYYLASGTSMAAPCVAGAAVRLRSTSAGLVPERVRQLLEVSAFDLVDPLGQGADLPGRDVYSGAGRLDLNSLMALAPLEAAVLSAPQPLETVAGSVQVTGSAYSDRGLSYVLEYGRAPTPGGWTPVTAGPAQVQNSLLGEWNTEGLDGLFSLRLRVGDSNAAQVLVYAVNSRKTEILSPEGGDTVTSWIDVTGSASDPRFHTYLVELGLGPESSQWTVIHQGTQPVVQGRLNSWHAGQLPDGWYKFRLRLITDQGEVAADTVAFYLRSTFSTTRAWKVSLGTPGAALVASFGDLLPDPALEIVVATSSGVRAFGPDGQVDAEADARFTRTGPCSTPLAIGDTDGDGRDDLVVVNDSGVIWIFPSSEQVRAIWTDHPPFLGNVKGIEEFILPGLFLQDSDGDGRDEIHYYPGYTQGELYSYWMFRSDGSRPLQISRDRFTRRLEFMEYFPADLDGDGLDELYVAGEQLYRLSLTGVVQDSVALVDSTGRQAQARTCTALDLDVDGLLELVVMAVTVGSPSTYVLYVFEDDLALKPGWPRNTGIDYYWVPSDPVFCDTDGDRIPEYFISWFDTELGRISAWHPDGSPLSGHSSYPVWTSSIDPAKFRSPIAADLNSDGLADLITCATEDMYLTFPVERIIAWNQLGHVLPGWPLIVESGGTLPGSSRRQTTATGDIDRDGTTDVMMVTSENNLVFVNVPGATFDSASARVEFWRYNRRLNNTVPVAGQLRVNSVQPTRMQADVATTTAIGIGFNLALDAAQDFSGVFEVRGSLSGPHAGTVTYDPFAKKLVFNSASDFVESETVSVHLPGGLRAESGSALPLDFNTAFMVAARVPVVFSPYPQPQAQNVDRHTPVSFGLVTGVDPRSLGDTTLRVVGNVHGLYPGSLSYDSVTRTATFVTHTAFAPAELITASVQPGIVSTQGIINDAEFSWTFAIAWPRATSTVPAAYATGAARSTFLSATLDSPLPYFAVHDSSMYVYSATAGRRAGAVSYVAYAQTLRFTPAEAFRLGEQMTAVVPALNLVWTFGINTVGGAIRFAPPVAHFTDTSPKLVTAGDIDLDGTVDLVAGRDPSPFVYLLRHAGAGTFRLDSVLTGGTVGQVLLADLDADSDLDLVAADQIGHSLAMLYNNGAGRFTPPRVLVVPGILECAAADFNADGQLDLMSQASTSAQVAILLGLGNGEFLELPRLAVPAALTSAVAMDFNADGRQDVAAADLLGYISLYSGDGDGAFTPHAAWRTGARVMHIAAADCDKDGDADLLVLHAGGALGVWRNAEGSFSLDTVYAMTAGARRMQVADFDADGRLDLVVAGGEDRKVHLLAGNSSGRFTPVTQLEFADSVWSVAVADFDSDGDLDLATGGERSLSVAYFGSGSAVGDETAAVVPGQFELSQNYPNPFNPSTTLGFAVPEPSHVNLAVFNILGRQVALLKDEVFAPGYYSLTWDGRSDGGSPLPTGVYFYRLKTEGVSMTRRMMLLK